MPSCTEAPGRAPKIARYPGLVEVSDRTLSKRRAVTCASTDSQILCDTGSTAMNETLSGGDGPRSPPEVRSHLGPRTRAPRPHRTSTSAS